MAQIADQPVALVTGAGRGLGRFLCRSLADNGYRVIQHYRKSSPPLEYPHLTMQADLSKEKELIHAFNNAISVSGRLDVLVNNSGVYHPKLPADLTEKEWFEGLHSTATAAFFMTRTALPLLRQSSRPRIINIGDSSCERLNKRDLSLSYHIGKTGVLLLTKSFALAEAPHHVTVNMVSPGMLANASDLGNAGDLPMGRPGEFQDVWGAVNYLLSPSADYVTGTNIIVAGGWNL